MKPLLVVLYELSRIVAGIALAWLALTGHEEAWYTICIGLYVMVTLGISLTNRYWLNNREGRFYP